MTARKTAKKTTAKKKPIAGKATPKKKAATKRKTTTTKAPSRPAAKSQSRKAASAGTPRKTKRVAQKPKEGVSSLSVNLGHVFSLRPRLSTTFRQADFRTAKHLLQDESYATIEEAARAVAAKALEMTHEGPPKRGFGR